MRLIDADKLRERLFSYYGCVNECTCKSNYNGEHLMAYEVADMIANCFDNATTINPVHAAGGCYCRECEHYNVFGDKTCRLFSQVPALHKDPFAMHMKPNDFCSYGRRREETDD